VSVEFGDLKILTGAEFSIETGERVCLIGRNGAGKSTTLKLIGGELEPDRGEIVCAHDLVTSQLAQTLPEAMNLPVRDVVRSGLNDVEALLAEYQQRSKLDLDRQGLQELEALHAKIDAHEGWHIEQRVETVITDLNLPADKKMNELSGGWRRRVALAKALVQKPDLLLLDLYMPGIDGDEVCGVWQHGDLEIHVSAAVAYGIWQYDRLIGDKEFLYSKGVEMLLQISRYYASRGEWSPLTREFGFWRVMGADEFHMMAHNNCYKNVMAAKAMQYTLDVMAEMPKARVA